MKYHLVINLGLRTIRAILFQSDGSVVYQNWYPITTYVAGTHVEQEPQEWWYRCDELLRELKEETRLSKDIITATVTTSSCCLVALDKQGVPTTRSILVSDRRAEKEAAEITALVSRQGGQSLIPSSYMLPKILWLKHHRPSVFAKTATYLNAGDFLVYKLTGEYCTDSLNAEKLQFDRRNNTYPLALLSFCGISEKQLPRVVDPGHIIRTKKTVLLDKYSLSPHMPIVISTYDALCAFIGSGVQKPGDANNVCGTVGSLRLMMDTNVHSLPGVQIQKIDNMIVAGGSNNIDGGLLEWAKNVFYGDAYQEKYVYTIMNDEASASPPGARGLFFLPYLLGERFPLQDAAVRGMFFGLERFHTRSDMMRSIFEAGAFQLRSMIELVEKSGTPVKNIYLSGGLARNAIVAQTRADITGRNIILSKQHESTSLGALYFCLKSQHPRLKFSAFAQKINLGTRYKPDSSLSRMYTDMFGLYFSLYNGTKHLMKMRDDFTQKNDTTEFVLENL